MSELKQVNQEMRTMSTQSKLAVAQLGNNASISDTYSTKMKSMGAEIQVAGNRTKMLTDLQKTLTLEQEKLPKLVDSATNSYKESNKETIKLRKSYKDLATAKGEDAEETLEAEKAYKSSLKQTNALKKEMKELEIVYRDNGKQLEKLPNDIAKAELATAKLTNAQAKLHEEYRNSGGRLADTAKNWQDFGDKAGQVSDTLNTAGNYMTTRFTVPIVTGFAAATTAAGKFQTEIGMLGPLIAEGGNITDEHRKQIEQLGTASREWAIDYGKSTSEINAGMAELIRNGYNSAQVIGMIPNVLDASLASGEDFNSVMKTSANVLSQFQLRGKDTNETLTNTQRVVDSLTYVANATSSGFYDLGQGMAYVGPVANTLNMSVEETASILGILSDNGIEASQGGTALRGALTRLLKPSKQNSEAMAELGINLEDYQNGLLDFPTILDTVAKNTANLTDEQKASLIATAFGTEAQSAMNALVAAGGDELRNMTTEAKNAAGATKEIAGAMQELPEFKFQQLMAEVRDLGIEVGTHLLPIVMDGMGVIKDWASAFGELDESTQQMIIKTGLAVAAAGPLLKTFGSIAKGAELGSKGISKFIQIYGKLTTPKAVTDTTTELGKIPGAASKAGGAAALFSNPWVIGGAVAIAGVAGFLAYLNHEAQAPIQAHQDAVEATEGKYQEWFDAVVSGSGTLAELNASGVAGAEEMAQAYENITKQVMDANRAIQDGLNEQWGDTSFWTGGGADTNLDLKFDDGSTRRYQLNDLQEMLVATGQVSETEMNRIKTAYNSAGTTLTNTMAQISSSKLNNEVVTKEWASGQINAVKNVATSTVENLKTVEQARIENVNQQREQRLISQAEADKEIASIESQTQAQINTVNDSQARIHAILKSASDSRRKLNSEEVTTMMFDIMTLAEATGQSFSEIDGASKLLGDNLEALASSSGLAFLESMGIIDRATSDSILRMTDMEEKTKALTKVLEEYGLVNPDTKEFDIDTTDAEVALQTIQDLATAWAELTFEERLAQVETRGKEEIEELLTLLGVDWNNLTPEQKEYYAQAEGGEALENILYLTGEWNRQTDPQKKFAVLETQIDSDALLGAIKARDLWNDADFMSLAMEIDTNAPDAKEQLVNLVNYFSEQKGLAPLQMETEALTEESQQKLAELISTYTGAPVDEVAEFLTSTNADETTGKIKGTGTALSKLDGSSASVSVSLSDNASWQIQRIAEQLSGIDGRTATAYVTTMRATHTYAEGGHIDAYAAGGNLKFAGAFATGGKIPSGYQGIVGEAGPEIFTVTDRGVSITPLNSNEKMRGVGGAVADEVSRQLGNRGGGINLTVNIDKPVVSNKEDINSLTNQIVRKASQMLAQQAKNKQKGRPTW